MALSGSDVEEDVGDITSSSSEDDESDGDDDSYYAGIRRQIDEYGYALARVPALTADKCDEYSGGLIDWYRKMVDGCEKGQGIFGPTHKRSLIQSHGVGHLGEVWNVRKAAADVFEKLWHTKELLTSTDGIGIGCPPEERGLNSVHVFEEAGDARNLHLDQSIDRRGLHSIQGAVYLNDATDKDWCLKVLKGSNKHHQEFCDRFLTKTVDDKKRRYGKHGKVSNYNELSKRDLEFYMGEKGCELVRVGCPSGHMILWDSRTVHAGARPTCDRDFDDLWRCVVFVCMTPAAWTTEEDLKKKKTAFNLVKTSNHYPSRGVSLFNRSANMISSLHEVKKQSKVASSSQKLKRLAGVNAYVRPKGYPFKPVFRD